MLPSEHYSTDREPLLGRPSGASTIVETSCLLGSYGGRGGGGALSDSLPTKIIQINFA